MEGVGIVDPEVDVAGLVGDGPVWDDVLRICGLLEHEVAGVAVKDAIGGRITIDGFEGEPELVAVMLGGSYDVSHEQDGGAGAELAKRHGHT